MYCCIDIGNSFTKIGVFQHQTLEHVISIPTSDTLEIIETISKHHFEKIIYACVGKLEKNLALFLEEQQAIPFSVGLAVEQIKIQYQTPETLGLDRVAGVMGAASFFENENILHISCGTCITYDMLDAKKQYHGGAISLGIKMRFAALNHYTAKLPDVSAQINSWERNICGKNTTQSILNGILEGSIGEMEHLIDEYSLKYPNQIVVLTGGDADFFEKHLKKKIFVKHHTVLYGLHAAIRLIS